MNEQHDVAQFPVIDPNESDRFLSIFGTDLFTFQTFDDRGRKDSGLARVYHGTREQVHASLVDLQRLGAGVYVTVNETDFRGRKTENVIGVRAYFADGDAMPLENGGRLGLEPTAVIESSPGRFNVFYAIADAPLIAENFRRTQQQLASLLGSDPSVCDLPRVMRLPGYLHQKNPQQPFLSRIHYLNADAIYTEAEFQEALASALAQFPPVIAKPQSKTEHAPRLNVSTLPPIAAAASGDLKEADPETGANIAKLQSALNHVGPDGKRVFDPDCKERRWKDVLMAVASLPWKLETRVAVAVEWSKQAPHRFNGCPGHEATSREDIEGHIIRFAKTGRDGRTERWIYGEAREADWEPPPLQWPSAETPSVFNRPGCRAALDPPAGDTGQPAGQPAPGLKIVDADALLTKPAPERRWCVDRWIPQAETTGLAGDGGTGKSTLALQLCAAATGGGKWLGLDVRRCNALYVSAEDPTEEIHWRLEHVKQQMKLAALPGLRVVDLAGRDAALAAFGKDGQIKPTGLFAAIETAAAEHGAGLIVLDASADMFGGNENERREVRAFVGALRGLAMRLDAAVVMLMHPSVDGIRSGRGYSGSTAWNNSVRSRLTFTVPVGEDGKETDPDVRVLQLAKTNRARSGERIHMRWAEGGFAVIPAGASSNPGKDLSDEAVFLELLDAVTRDGINVSAASKSSTYAPAEFAKRARGKETGKGALERAMHRLLEKRTIRQVTEGPASRLRGRLVRADQGEESVSRVTGVQPG
jgi:RecA-family ATPase